MMVDPIAKDVLVVDEKRHKVTARSLMGQWANLARLAGREAALAEPGVATTSDAAASATTAASVARRPSLEKEREEDDFVMSTVAPQY
jgi:hypothetical protein